MAISRTHSSSRKHCVKHNYISVLSHFQGTPSLAGPRLVEIVLEAVGRYSCLSNKPEICLEANPSSTQLSKLKYVFINVSLVMCQRVV